MATKLFVSGTAGDYGTGNNDANLRGTASAWVAKSLSLTAGASAAEVQGTTVAGLTNGVEPGATPQVYYSPPLDAAVTISGSITWNIWAREATTAANVAINGRLEVIDGATGTITLIDQTARITEVAISSSSSGDTVNNFAETPAAGVACKRGDRLRVRLFGDDAGTMGSGVTFAVSIDGPTGGALGDTWLQLTENLTFAAEPAGTQIFPTDTASGVTGANVEREAWTSRGAGVQTDVTNTTTGWTAPIQMTDTAGGTAVEWFTRPLTAFTLGGAVRCHIRAQVSNTLAQSSISVQIARVAGDGTGATVWANGTRPGALLASEAAHSFLLSGTDLAVTDGQRLRVRVSIDDRDAFAMASGQTATLYYAGTSGGASGDTYLTFSQALTEYVIAGAANPPYTNPYPSVIAQ